MSAKTNQAAPKKLKAAAITVQVSHQIELKRLADLLVGCMEGGSNYWVNTADAIKPPGDEELTFVYDDQHMYPRYTYPFNEGGALAIYLIDDKQLGIFASHPTSLHRLTLDKIKKGTELFAAHPDYAHHFKDFVQENDDATTADVWLQLCLFGKVIYG